MAGKKMRDKIVIDTSLPSFKESAISCLDESKISDIQELINMIDLTINNANVRNLDTFIDNLRNIEDYVVNITQPPPFPRLSFEEIGEAFLTAKDIRNEAERDSKSLKNARPQMRSEVKSKSIKDVEMFRNRLKELRNEMVGFNVDNLINCIDRSNQV